MTKVAPDILFQEIQKELEVYSKETTEAMREVVEEVTKEAVGELRATSPRRTGRYQRGWTSRKTTDSSTALTRTLYNRWAGLTHLLEKGHAKRNGGRVEGKPHITPVEKRAMASLENRLKERVKRL